MLTSLIIRALRPVLVPLFLEALEQHTRARTTPVYTNGNPITTWLR